ncbi:MAG: methyltransferase [Hydrotalea sp.]|nr:methyltransferase [Hydrotalea sp.]
MTITRDFILDKQLVLNQYRAGYRVAVDSVLLGAMVDKNAQDVIDLGAGVGAVSLVAGFWNRQATICAVEKNADYFSLLQKNLLHDNPLLHGGQRFSPHHGDINQFVPDKKFCQVLINPPFDQANTTTAPPDELKSTAFVFQGDDDIKNWWRVGLRLLRDPLPPPNTNPPRLSFITRGNMEGTIVDFFNGAGGGTLAMQRVMTRGLGGERVIRWLVDFQPSSSATNRNDAPTIIRARDFILQETIAGKMVYTQLAESILRGREHHPFPF